MHIRSLILSIFVTASAAFAQTSPRVVSDVDTSLQGASKYFLRVDGQPFYPIDIQVRLDKLRYWWGWDAPAREATLERAAEDGFNTVSLPIHWYEVEPTKDNFDWTILDEYLTDAWRHGLRVELLWFGQDSGGQTQWLGNISKNPVHLRTPDYVLYSPHPKSRETTSEYRIRRDMSDYTLDLADDRLVARESYVLGKVMSHVAEWDGRHNASHVVIGVQLDNEVHGLNGIPFPAALDVAYCSKLGAVVKNGPYRVWTRMNCVWTDTASRIIENERLRESAGTGIDFVGTDLYRNNGNGISVVRHEMPYIGRNYRMIMECGADDEEAGLVQLAALAGNNALDFYEFCGPDNHGMYVKEGVSGFAARGKNTATIRTVNRMLRAVNADVATHAQGYGLFVHNWDGHQPPGTLGVRGVCFSPKSPTSQAVSLQHDASSIVILTSLGGSFTWPASLGVKEAEEGEFAAGNGSWVSHGEVKFSGRLVELSAGDVVLLKTAPGAESPQKVYQAEFARLGGAAVIEASADSLGFAANGYVRFHRAGESLYWQQVEGCGGGGHRIAFRYANGTNQIWKACVFVNGVPHKLEFPSTGGWDVYRTADLNSELLPGATNQVSLETAGQGDCHLDEMQIF